MSAYEKITSSNLPVYKKFEMIDGRECLVNFVLLVEVDGTWAELPFERVKQLSTKPYIRTPEQNE